MLNEQDLKPLIQKYEAKMGVEIIVVLAKSASNYLTVPLIYAILLSLPVPFLLYHLTNLTFNLIMSLQLLAFALIFLLIHFTPLKRLLIPSYHINDRLKQRARDILWAYNAFTKHNHGAILFFIADFEQKGIVRADKFLKEKISETFLDELTLDFQSHQSIEKTLELAAITIISNGEKPNVVDNSILISP